MMFLPGAGPSLVDALESSRRRVVVRAARADDGASLGRAYFFANVGEVRRCPRCRRPSVMLRAAPLDAPCLECSRRSTSSRRVEVTPAVAAAEPE